MKFKHIFSDPKNGIGLLLGFSAGLPFALVGNTLGFWLRDSGIELAMIGFLSWVGLTYSFKFIWAPLVDKTRIPILGSFLGARRGWMLFTQLLLMIALLGMAFVTPQVDLTLFAAFTLLAAAASATQDTVIDAWRIEAADSNEQMAVILSAFQFGYRGATLLTDALILIMAANIGWSLSYMFMGIAVSVGMIATFLAPEPKATQIRTRSKSFSLNGVWDAIAGPIIEFFKHHGTTTAALMLAIVGLYRLGDFIMGPMANPFYSDLGISKETVGVVRGSIGLVMSLAGIAAGGLCVARFGMMRTLIVGALIGPMSNLAFSAMALAGPNPIVFSVAMGIDNFSGGFAGCALMTYMSSLTSVGYTATQYALLSSFFAMPGKILKGLSGVAVETLQSHYDLLTSYAIFFAGTAMIGIPVVLLLKYCKSMLYTSK